MAVSKSNGVPARAQEAWHVISTLISQYAMRQARPSELKLLLLRFMGGLRWRWAGGAGMTTRTQKEVHGWQGTLEDSRDQDYQ